MVHPPIPLHCRCSFIHVFIHSFFSHIAPSPDCPPAHKGWRFLTDPREWGWGRCTVSASPSRRVCNCSGPRRPQGQSGAVPARLGRTRSSGPSRLGGLGPVSQPQDLMIQSRPGRIESSCSWGRGKEAGQEGGGVSGGIKNCGLCPFRSWGPGEWNYLGKTEPVDKALSSCPCPGPRPHSLSSGGRPGTLGQLVLGHMG